MLENKQIIIDGVDVNDCHNRTFYKNDEGDVQCKCYRFEDADSDTLLFGICKQHPHCYYKQLKVKEQECEELKIYIESNEQQVKEVENLVMDNDRLINELDQLKAENEELKKQTCGLRPELKYIIDKTCCKYNINAKYYHEKIVEIINNLDKYKQTLTEIKEIAEHPKGCCIICDRLDKILQKISEVENAL